MDTCLSQKNCSECLEIENTVRSLQLCDGVRNQTICMRKLGSYLRRCLKQSNVCQVAVRRCSRILAVFASGQKDSDDNLGHCLPLANSVQSVAIHILEQLELLNKSFSTWFQIMNDCNEYSKEQPIIFQLSTIVLKKFNQLLHKVFCHLKFQSPQTDLFHSVFFNYFEKDRCSSLLLFQGDTQHPYVSGSDIRFISVVVYEASSRALILYPLYRKEPITNTMKQRDISMYENECCMIWFGLVILSSDVLYEYYNLFYTNNCIESTMKLLRHCLWIVLSDHDESHVCAILNFINRTSEVRILLRALTTQLEWFISQERIPRDSILAASFSWICLQSLLCKPEIDSQNVEEEFDISRNFEVWMKSVFPSFSKLSICIGVIDYLNYMNKSSSERTLETSMNNNASLLMAIFRTLQNFCQLREDSHFHFMALDGLRRCILKLIDSSLMTAELIREIFTILWQRCQEPIRGVSNQMRDIIQDLLSLSSDSRVPVSEQQRMKLFFEKNFINLCYLEQFQPRHSTVGSFCRSVLLYSCSTLLESFWKLLLEEVGEQCFIEKTRGDLLESIMSAKNALQEERLISQALGTYLKLPTDRTDCLVTLLNGISDISRDDWHTTKLKLIVLSNGRKHCPGLSLRYLEDLGCFSVSERESTVTFSMEELNLALSSENDICRFAVIDCLTESSSKVEPLDSFELRLLPQLLPWFLFESKSSASWRFLHIISRLLKRLEHSIDAKIRERQTSFLQWEHNVVQRKQPIASVAEVDVFLFQAVEVLLRM
ncbi:Probable phospholipid-transporting ATPase IIB [Galdieria sulphuraria]|nr:Probable phospholipid-transporting ATPase IIB [Galdieria sulphuraria]